MISNLEKKLIKIDLFNYVSKCSLIRKQKQSKYVFVFFVPQKYSIYGIEHKRVRTMKTTLPK